ncbi:hypothetical protein, partial [Streptomyces sp. NPDC058953]|uniref:hypothetical protein n=1 Tax=Streptomyces sp. NPDC058953 TaxID=3346676 RepID=UPI00367CF94C
TGPFEQGERLTALDDLRHAHAPVLSAAAEADLPRGKKLPAGEVVTPLPELMGLNPQVRGTHRGKGQSARWGECR